MPKITGTRSYNVRITQHVTLEVSDAELAANRDTWFDDCGYATPDLDQYMCDNGTFTTNSEQQLDNELEYTYEPDGGVIDYAPIDEQVPNTGSLEGIACPRCGSAESFEILAMTTATLHDSGCDDNSGYEWAPTSRITCGNCRHVGDVLGFRTQPTSACVLCTGSVFVAKDGMPHHYRTDGDPMFGPNYVDHHADADPIPAPGAAPTGTPVLPVRI